MSALGNHILVEFSGCNPEIMNDVATIEHKMVEAAEKAGATVINSTFHHFSPYGVSGVVVIQESHLAIHTWPEYGYAAVDLFTCGDQVDAWLSFDLLKEAFEAKNSSALEMKRGSLNLLDRMDFDIKTMREEAKMRQNPGKYNRNVWFTDKDDNQALSLRYTGEILYQKDTDYQKVKILESYKYGKMLTLDNMVMTTEKDEFHYHEMISHPAMFLHQSPKKILVIGGGDGGTVRELLRHDNVEHIDMVEIDRAVIEACKEHLPGIAASFDDPRLNVLVEDGIAYVKNASDASYDMIIVDGSDPVGPAEGLFSVSFYDNCRRVLNDNGILVAQGESPKFNEHAFKDLNHTLKELFNPDNVHVMLFYVPTYPTGMWSFQWATKQQLNVQELDEEKINQFEKEKGLRYYNAAIHKASFALPGFVKSLIND